METLCIMILAALVSACASAAPITVESWDADVNKSDARVVRMYRGESVRLAPRFVAHGEPVQLPCNAAEFLWQTNGMGASWWTSTATVTGSTVWADITPAMTPPCSQYRFFFRTGTNGVSYRANGTVRVAAGPGAEPNTLAPPWPPLLDFSKVTVTNEPWATDGTIQDGVLSSDLDAGWHTINNLDFGPITTNESFRTAVTNAAGGTTDYNALRNRPTFAGSTVQGDMSELGVAAQTGDNVHLVTNCFAVMDDMGHATLYHDGEISRSTDFGETFRDYVLPRDIPPGTYRFAITDDLEPYATKEYVSAWTNAQLVVSNEVLAVQVESNQTYRTVWKSSETNKSEIDDLKRQAIELLARVEALEQGGGASTWNSFAADSTPNPDPEYMTFLNRPATVFGSGFSWESSGAYSVLVQSGSVAFATGSDGGEFRIGPDSTNHFGFAMGGSIVVGAECQSMDAATAGQENGVIRIKYAYSGTGGFPTLWYAPSLAVDFSEQTGVVWVDNQDGSCTVTAPATTASGFWYATTSKQISSVFKSTMPARFDGGVFGATNSLPVVYDSTIEIEHGGHTYRIPAEFTR